MENTNSNNEQVLNPLRDPLNHSLEVLKEYKTAIISVTKKDLERFDAKKGDTEGLTNLALSLNIVNRAAFFTEDNGYVKISFRSKGEDNPVNGLASQYFEGGGHINAAGGKFVGDLESAIKKFISVLPEFVNQ